jgi:5-methylcytosine-specific restriction endonuclease McrA/endogenous inhibitor of DNA gyrase (YacG/DUF329 family)
MKCYQTRIKSSETLEKMAAAKRGRIPWNKGVAMWKTRNHPKGTLGKPSKLKGRKLSEEHRKKLCFPKPKPTLRQIKFQCKNCNEIFISKKAHKKYVPRYCSQKCFGDDQKKEKYCPICQKHVSWINSTFCSNKCRILARIGTKTTQESKEKMSRTRKGNPRFSGENHWNWKEGKTALHEKIRKSTDYSIWRRKVFERDDFTCVLCKIRGVFLHADHIKPFCTHPELRLEISNGRTLCVGCHRKTDTYGTKALKRIKLCP